MTDKKQDAQRLAFEAWCHANPKYDLDARLHQHGRDYISDETTRIAFAAWQAAHAQATSELADVNGDMLLNAQMGDELPLPFRLQPDNWFKTPLYAATPPAPMPLTDEQLRKCFLVTNTAEPLAEGWPGIERFARAIERISWQAALASTERPAQQEAAHWQPIETAPKDGQHILAFWPLHPFDDDDNMDESKVIGGVRAVTFRNGDGWIEPDYLDATGAWFGDDCCYAPAPTLWQPLPPPPKSGIGAKE